MPCVFNNWRQNKLLKLKLNYRYAQDSRVSIHLEKLPSTFKLILFFDPVVCLKIKFLLVQAAVQVPHFVGLVTAKHFTAKKTPSIELFFSSLYIMLRVFRPSGRVGL